MRLVLIETFRERWKGMKKLFIALILLMLPFALIGCNGKNGNNGDDDNKPPIKR